MSLLVVIEGLILIASLILLHLFKTDKEIIRLIWVTHAVFSIVAIFIVNIPSKDYWQNLSIIVGFGITIIGWFFNSYFNNQQAALENKNSNDNAITNTQREIKIKYLIDSYLKIEASNARDSEPIVSQFLYWKNLESAIGAASLFGDSELVRRINLFANRHTDSLSEYSKLYLSVLYQFRTDLRNELKLDSFLNGLNITDSSYNITYYRRWIRDSIRKTNPEYYNKIEVEQAQKSTER